MKHILCISLFFIVQFVTYTAKAESNIIADSVNVTLLRGIPAVPIKKISIGTIHVGEKVENGCALYNQTKHRLDIEKLVVSDSGMEFKVSRSWMMPEWKIGLLGTLQFKVPIGKFRSTVKVYYKGVKKPTVVLFEGNVIK